MAAIRIAGGYITKGPPWAKRFNGLKLGRLRWGPGETPEHLRSYFFTSAEVKDVVAECKSKGITGGPGLVKCIFTTIGNRRRKG